MAKDIPLKLKINAAGNALRFLKEINKSFGKTLGATKQMTSGVKELNTSIKQASSGLSSNMKRISQSFKDTTRNLKTGINNVTRSYDNAANKLANSSKKINFGQSLKNFGVSAAVASASAGLLGGSTISSFANYELEMNKVKALTKASGVEFKELSDLAKTLGSTTQFSASQAAEGMGFLGMAGFKTDQILKAMPATLNLATAAQLDLGSTADIVSNIMSGFKIKASDIGKASDVLSSTFQHSNTTLLELAEAFKASGPIAKTLGISFEEVNATLGILASSGYKGERAGTALAGGLSRLIKPTSEIKKAFKALDITTQQYLTKDGRLPSFVKVLNILKNKGASTAQFMSIFGQEAGKALVALKEDGVKNIRSLSDVLKNSAGATKFLADSYKKGVSGAIKSLKSAFEGFQIAVGESGLGKVFAKLTNLAADFFRVLSDSNPFILNTVSILGGLVFIAAPLTFIIGQLIISFKAITSVMTIASIPAGILSIKLLLISSAVGVAVYAGWFLWKNWKKIGIKIDNLWKSLPEGFRNALKKYIQFFVNFWKEVKPVFSAIYDFISDIFGKLFDWIGGDDKKLNKTAKLKTKSEHTSEWKFLPDVLSGVDTSVPNGFKINTDLNLPAKNFTPEQALNKLGYSSNDTNSSFGRSAISSGVKVVVDFNNTPTNTAIHSETSNDIDLDLNVAYQNGGF